MIHPHQSIRILHRVKRKLKVTIMFNSNIRIWGITVKKEDEDKIVYRKWTVLKMLIVGITRQDVSNRVNEKILNNLIYPLLKSNVVREEIRGAELITTKK